MKIIFNPKEIRESAVLAIGNFDGVHLGHRYLLEKAAEIAAKKSLPLAVMTFEPHPLHLFAPQLVPARITTMKTKLLLLAELGVDKCYIMKFGRTFSQITAVDFADKFLSSCHVVTGFDFSFGNNRMGNSALLKEILGGRYTPIAAKGEGGQIFSSSAVRELLKQGNVAAANKILGYEYGVEGNVVSGSAAGFEFRTANLRLHPHLMRPQYGVYVVKTGHGYGVANFGKRPTVDGEQEFLEVHIFDFNKNIYGEKLNVKFLDFIREEKKFGSVEILKNQIAQDIKDAQKIVVYSRAGIAV